MMFNSGLVCYLVLLAMVSSWTHFVILILMYMSNQLFKMPLGKTIIARYIAAKAGFKFLVLTPAKLEDKWVGGTSQNWERAFEFAAAHAPCIIFFDELGKHSFSKF